MLSKSQHVHIGRSCRILKRLPDVLVLEVRVVLEDLVERPSGGNEPDNRLDRDPETTDGGPALKLARLRGDPVEGHGSIVGHPEP